MQKAGNLMHNIKKDLIESKFLLHVYEAINKKLKVASRKKITNALSRLDKKLARISYRIMSGSIDIKDNRILFLSFRGGFDCNPKAIALEIMKEDLPYEIVWVVRSENLKKINNLPNDLEIVRWGSLDFYEKAASSRIIIDNSTIFGALGLTKKKNQTYINTWHGSIGLKGLGDVKDKKWIKTANYCAKNVDFIISNSDFETNVYRTTYWKQSNIVKLGHARNDILLSSQNDRAKLKKKVSTALRIPDNKKIVLYAPTFRDNNNFEVYDIDYTGLKEALEERFGGDWIILVRFHFTVKKYLAKHHQKIKIPEFVHDATDYFDIQDILAICDAGITDYSSWICDFILTRNPAFIFAKDLASYYDERGFAVPLSATPFTIAEDNQQLFDNIMNFDEKEYRIKCDRYLEKHGSVDDGLSSRRIVSLITDILYDEQHHGHAPSETTQRTRRNRLENKDKYQSQLKQSIRAGNSEARIELFDLLWDDNNLCDYKDLLFYLKPLIDLDHPDSQIRVARMKSTGRLMHKDIEGAIDLLERLSKEGNINAMMELLYVLYKSQDYHRQYDYLKTLESEDKQKDDRINGYIAYAYWKGIGTEKNIIKASDYMRLAIKDNPVFCYDYCDILLEINSKESCKKMVGLLEPMAESNDPESIYRLSYSYMNGKGVVKDLKKAERLAWDSLNLGHEESKYLLADILFELKTEESKIKLEWLIDNNKGDGELLARIGLYYKKSTDADIDKSIHYLEKAYNCGVEWATVEYFKIMRLHKPDELPKTLVDDIFCLADKGNIPAQYHLGFVYRDGLYVEPDVIKEAFYFRIGANNGIPHAYDRLFDALWRINSADAKKEMKSFAIPMAQKGDKDMMGRVGKMYYRGKGVKKDLVMAEYWFQKAADLGLEWADKYLCEISMMQNSCDN
jgi:CDP-glycerol glycerophosphotransferase